MIPEPETLALRSAVLQAIRDFFSSRDFVEVTTPVRLPAPALESFIDAIPSGDQYLRTSPELHMKRLLVGGSSCIYQMGPCFRDGERGHLHSPEFTMLEWYRTDADYETILDDTKALIREVVRAVHHSDQFHFRDTLINVDQPWQRLSVAEAFLEFDADRFDLDLINKV